MSKLKLFAKVFTISENTKNDIIRFTDCPKEKIEVIMQTTEDFFNNSPIEKKMSVKNIIFRLIKKNINFWKNFYKNNEIAYKV